jgi:hypothetical protein
MDKHIELEVYSSLACKIVRASVIFLALICFLPLPVSAQTNLLVNPNLAGSTANNPDHWQRDFFAASPDDVTFESTDDSQPELDVWNYQPADARWTQTLHLKPGWYHFTASVRTENVGEVDTGANISIMNTWFLSRHVRGSGYWEPIGFYLQVPAETDVEFACRLGFYSSGNTGRAHFRDLSVVNVTAPVNDGDPRYTLQVKTASSK